jgi:Zn-dependent protease
LRIADYNLKSAIRNPQSEIAMLLGEPAPSPADLHFRLFGIPVRVSPWFWVVSLLLGMGGGPADPVNTLIWVGVVFVSILVHELGHAFTQRYYGGNPWITLYSFGGLASCNDCDRSPRSQILILLAGPGAGFLLAGAVVAILVALGRFDGFVPDLIPVRWTYFASDRANVLVWYLLVVNILWGIVNLLPVYPLDGGQIARELFTLKNPRAGIVRSLQISVATAAVVAVYALTQQSFFTCVMFGALAYSSYQALASYRNSWR